MPLSVSRVISYSADARTATPLMEVALLQAAVIPAEASARRWLAPEAVAELLDLTKEQVLALVRAGRLPAARLSRKLIRIDATKLADLLANTGGHHSTYTTKIHEEEA